MESASNTGRSSSQAFAVPGIKYIALATVAVLASLGVAWLVAKPLGISLATAAGLFAGSGTSTPTLQAALAAAGNQDPAIGYSVSYPFGVVGPIILMTIMAALLKPKFDPAVTERAGCRADAGIEMPQQDRRRSFRPPCRMTSRSSRFARTT